MNKKRTARKINWFVLGLIGLPVMAIGSFLWVTSLMDSAQAYRSPLSSNPLTPGPALGSSLTRRVVVVLIDALRYDTSTNFVVMPFLNGLRLKGASATMHSQPPSYSAPAWATILTGAWPDINDSQPFNPPDASSARPFSQDNIFSAAQRLGLKTAVSGFVWFKDMLAGSPANDGFYTPGIDKAADKEVLAASLPWLDGDDQLVLIHLDQIDYAVHDEGGPTSSSWDAAATRVDTILAEIVAHMDLKMDTVLVISDHGQLDRGGHGGPDSVTLLEPFVLVGAGVVPGKYGDINMVDVAPTLAALLGTNIPASNQGHVLTIMLTLTPLENAAIRNALQAQQSTLFTAYSAAIRSNSRLGTGDIVSATQAAMAQARLARLGTERIWRNVLAAFLAILPGYMLFLRKEKKSLWFLSGAILYLLLFNLRYSFIDGQTYSLSAIKSADWLITYTATTAAASVVLAWLVLMIGLRAFKSGPRLAVVGTLGYLWFTIYLLALPILLSFALNGFLVTWTLPEFSTLYIGVLSLIQCLIVSVIGILLVGISVLIGKLATKRA
jgi:hypothetical protein